MITTPAIYADNESQISSDLSPPARRTTTWLNWFSAILAPQQWLNNLVFTKYYGGSNASNWVSGNAYSYQDNVKYVDYCIYECTNPNGLASSTTSPNLDTANWMRILDTFVGIGERVLYTGQTAMLEYILNYYFSVGTVSLPWTRASHSTQIYISNNTLANVFWLTNASNQTLTSYMANNSASQKQFMHAASSYNPYAFTIYVPSATATAITANQQSGVTYKDVITSIVQKYCQLNFLFTITTY